VSSLHFFGSWTLGFEFLLFAFELETLNFELLLSIPFSLLLPIPASLDTRHPRPNTSELPHITLPQYMLVNVRREGGVFSVEVCT
jgi:hypothetical protein